MSGNNEIRCELCTLRQEVRLQTGVCISCRQKRKYLVCYEHTAHIKVHYLICLVKCDVRVACPHIAEFLKEGLRLDLPGEQGVLDDYEA